MFFFRTVIEGNQLLLSCTAEGKPEPTIRWSKNGDSLSPGNISQKLGTTAWLAANGAELRIEHVGVEATGRFSCEASNRAGLAEQDFFVDVQGANGWMEEDMISFFENSCATHFA